MRGSVTGLIATLVTCAVAVSGCGGTTAPSKGTPFSQVFTGDMPAGGYMEYPITLEGPGTLRVSLTAEGNDLFFLVTDENRGCVRQDCVPLARMTAEHQLQCPVFGRQRVKLVIWHVLDAGEPRTFSLSAVFE